MKSVHCTEIGAVLNWILGEQTAEIWTGLNWLRTGSYLFLVNVLNIWEVIIRSSDPVWQKLISYRN